jgi:hypothetical protein
MNNVLLETVFGSKLKETCTYQEAFDLFNSMDLIAHGELAEKAISKKSGIQQCAKNQPYIDLVSGVQIKYAQTNYETQSYSGSLKAHISIKNHTETILAVVTETVTNKQYFFCFPYSSYMDYRGNTFTIPFDLYGNPRRTNGRWCYEIESWEKLCELAK